MRLVHCMVTAYIFSLARKQILNCLKKMTVKILTFKNWVDTYVRSFLLMLH